MKVSSFFQSRWRLLVAAFFGVGIVAATFWWRSPSHDHTTTPTALVDVTQPFQDPNAPPKDHRDPEVDGEPGFYEQWYDMRKDENGLIPTGLRQQWHAHDRQQLALYSGARSAKPYQSMAFLGPTDVGGRTRALMVDRANVNRIFAGGISGGLWRSNNGGSTWVPINDAASSLAVSSITQNPFNTGEIYYGTGESRGNSAGLSGAGVWKSTDGGNTFSQLSSTASLSHFTQIWKIEHSKDPNSPNTVYVGTNFGGLYRSIDGGNNWTQVLGSPSQINDIITFADGGVMVSAHGNGIYYSPTGAAGTFTQQAQPNLPNTSFRRIEIEPCAAFPDVIYALYEKGSGDGLGDLMYTNDRGQTWTPRSAPASGNTFSRYCIMLGVHAADTNQVVVGASSSQFRYSVDGGNNWSAGDFTHADHHIVAYDPQDPNVFYTGNDGGVYKHTWTSAFNALDLNLGYHTTQFYAGFYGSVGDQAFGGTQDNGTHSVGGPTNLFQYKIAGGDGGPAYINLQSPTGDGYQSYQRGRLFRIVNMANQNLVGFGPRLYLDTMIDEGINFIHPYTINRTDGLQIYYPTRRGMWASNDGGDNFRKIAGGSSSLATFYTVEAAPSLNPTVYYGGSSGRLYRIDNAATAAAGGSQTRMTLPAFISSRTIGGIHAVSDSTIFVCFTTMASFPHVWKVTNANSSNPTWTNISGNLPNSLPINRVAVNPADHNQIHAATDFGLYYTEDGGATWLKNTALPNVAVFDVHIRPSDQKLFIFTHGRGVWLAELSTLVATRPLAASTDVFSPNTFPNPVQDRIHVRNQFGAVEGVRLMVYDLQGRLLLQQSNVNLGATIDAAASVAVGQLPPATYALVVQTKEGERQTFKFIKQ